MFMGTWDQEISNVTTGHFYLLAIWGHRFLQVEYTGPPVISMWDFNWAKDLADNLLKKFAQVRPICKFCERSGLKPLTQAPRMDNPDAKKRKK